MKYGSLSRVTVGEGLVPHVEPSFFRFTADTEITQDEAHSDGYEGQCGVMRRNLSRKRLKVSSGSTWTLTITRFFYPDCTFTIWSRPWQVITCVTIAS